MIERNKNSTRTEIFYKQQRKRQRIMQRHLQRQYVFCLVAKFVNMELFWHMETFLLTCLKHIDYGS